MTEWTDLIKNLPHMTEEEIKTAIAKEANGPARASRLTRMHQRMSKLRTARERRALLNSCS